MVNRRLMIHSNNETFELWWMTLLCDRSIVNGQRSKVKGQRSKVKVQRLKVNRRFMIHSNNETFDLWQLTWCQRSIVNAQRSQVKGQRSKVKGKRSKVKGQSSKVKAWSQSSKTFSYDFFNMRPMTSQITLESCAETADQLFECILRNKWESCGCLIFGHNFVTIDDDKRRCITSQVWTSFVIWVYHKSSMTVWAGRVWFSAITSSIWSYDVTNSSEVSAATADQHALFKPDDRVGTGDEFVFCS